MSAPVDRDRHAGTAGAGAGRVLGEFYRLAGGEQLPSRGRRLLIDYIRRAERRVIAPLGDQLGPQPRETRTTEPSRGTR